MLVGRLAIATAGQDDGWQVEAKMLVGRLAIATAGQKMTVAEPG